MVGRDHVEESLHYLMINVLVDSLEREGYKVLADHVGGLRERPSAIGGFTPDIEASKGEDRQIIEVKTQSTIDTPGSRQQLTQLTSACDRRVCLAVPFDCIEMARQLRSDLGVHFEILPCYPFVRYVGMPK